MERFFGVFCKTRKTTSGDWFAILSSFIHSTTLNQVPLVGQVMCWMLGIRWWAKWTQSSFYGACHMVQLHQREWRVGEAPCSLFYDTHPSGKIQPFWFPLHRLLWRGVIHSTSIYMNSFSLPGQDKPHSLLFALVSSEILQTKLPSSLEQYKTIPFSFPFSTWCMLRLL